MNVSKINNAQPSFKAYIMSPEGQKSTKLVNVDSIDSMEERARREDLDKEWVPYTNIYTKAGKTIEMGATIAAVMVALKKALNGGAKEIVRIVEQKRVKI